jgi:CspA family cold shock protein
LIGVTEVISRRSTRQSIFIGDIRVSETYKGTVKFVSDRGFLFMIPDGAGPEVFGHISEFERNKLREPEQGERYEFEVVQKPKGPTLINPRPIL